MIVKITDISTEYEETEEVYAEISKEDTKRLFNGNYVTKNDKEELYNFGELQFVFNKEGSLNEILLATVYKIKDDEDELCFFENGSIITAPEEISDNKTLIKFIEDKLKEFKEEERNNGITFWTKDNSINI